MFEKIANYFSEDCDTVPGTLACYSLDFTTLDGKSHVLSRYVYVNENGITCSGADYLANEIVNQKYVKDNRDNYYPISAILSFRFIRNCVIENFPCSPYKILYNPIDITGKQ